MSRQGRYLPVFAAEIYDQNAKLAAAGLTPVNLQSVMIGMSKFHHEYDRLMLVVRKRHHGFLLYDTRTRRHAMHGCLGVPGYEYQVS